MQAHNDKADRIILRLEECIQLLSENDEKGWADGLTSVKQHYIESDNKREALYLIRKLYGGSGSFSDIVLHKDEKPLIDENNKLKKSRHDLFEECIKLMNK